MQRSRSWSDSRGRLTLVLHYPDCVETSLTWVPPRCNVEKSSSKGELSTWAMSRSMPKSKVENSSHSINVVECLQDYRLISVLLEVVQRKPDYMGSAQLLLGARRVRERDLLPSSGIAMWCFVAFSGIFPWKAGTCKPLNLPRTIDGRTDFSFGMEKARTFLGRTKLSTYQGTCI